jgi:hypothetical protein
MEIDDKIRIKDSQGNEISLDEEEALELLDVLMDRFRCPYEGECEEEIISEITDGEEEDGFCDTTRLYYQLDDKFQEVMRGVFVDMTFYKADILIHSKGKIKYPVTLKGPSACICLEVNNDRNN